MRIDGAAGDERRVEPARAAIVRAATELFLAHGFQATGTDRIAAAAAVSKQTVYNQFGDKRSLFAAVVLGVTATAEAYGAELTATLGAVERREDVGPALRRLAHRWASAVLGPNVLAVRRLVVAEAARFPELAAEYHRRAPGATLRTVADGLARLAGRGLVEVDDPERTASDLAFLLFGAELDRALFHPDAPGPDERRIDELVDHALRVVGLG
ncbi:TetR/AcrR family transcriptional regulator [Actinomycetospora termitidis]|uniref:TetR/AcrR family transcriptional regulator n=1 Tax=Actinomycetospora termitidis TaxID=3053470 RepID=A0ABT7M391_9PSEU|nr:TetR/AcrR family transcriptional regulator [Actinomycetospora sp. Odt1-22]MDL5154482.1 TetR/AcrR family transcriptional regulator [Actinomycetospora sp. Odt1-22]